MCGDVTGITKMSASRCVHSVSSALCRHLYEYIQFPTTEAQQRQVKADFHGIANFPNVLGSIDGSIIPIRGPVSDEPVFVSRKGGHGMNVQIVNNAQLHITNIVARWPGSTHDSHIWNMCGLNRALLEGALGAGWLLGDSGYACSTRMMTPILTPHTVNDRRYNVSQRKTRNSSERTIGVWKMRFLHVLTQVWRMLDVRAVEVCWDYNGNCYSA